MIIRIEGKKVFNLNKNINTLRPLVNNNITASYPKNMKIIQLSKSRSKLKPKPNISDSYRRLSPAGESIIVVWNSRHRFGSFLALLKGVDVFFQSGNKVKHYFVQYVSFQVIKERHTMTHGMSSSNLKIK